VRLAVDNSGALICGQGKRGARRVRLGSVAAAPSAGGPGLESLAVAFDVHALLLLVEAAPTTDSVEIGVGPGVPLRLRYALTDGTGGSLSIILAPIKEPDHSVRRASGSCGSAKPQRGSVRFAHVQA